MVVEISRRLIGGVWRTGPGDEGAGGAGGPQLTGPFRVTHADITGSNPATQGFVLASFDEGAIVLDVWAVPVTAWNSVDARLQLSLRNPAEGGEYFGLYYSVPRLTAAPAGPTYPADVILSENSNSWDANVNWAFNNGDDLTLPARIRATGAELVATLDDHTGDATAGEIDVYALYIPAAS